MKNKVGRNKYAQFQDLYSYSNQDCGINKGSDMQINGTENPEILTQNAQLIFEKSEKKFNGGKTSRVIEYKQVE